MSNSFDAKCHMVLRGLKFENNDKSFKASTGEMKEVSFMRKMLMKGSSNKIHYDIDGNVDPKRENKKNIFSVINSFNKFHISQSKRRRSASTKTIC